MALVKSKKTNDHNKQLKKRDNKTLYLIKIYSDTFIELVNSLKN